MSLGSDSDGEVFVSCYFHSNSESDASVCSIPSLCNKIESVFFDVNVSILPT